MKHVPWYLLAALAAGNAIAESGARRDPADAEARVPPAEYQSAFDGYRALESNKTVKWREANEEVRRVGGHLGVLREQSQSARQDREQRK